MPLPWPDRLEPERVENLGRVGINVNLAPVLDVYRQAGDFIDQYQRSYSRNPGTVASLGAGFVGAEQRTGVAATAKHFPGLGSATESQNTDVVPVTLRSSLRTLRGVDEAPYRTAIAAGVKLVMTSWAIYPALDPHMPAGLSSAVIQGELRRRLGFRGVTVTDGIDAGAIASFGSLGRRAVLAASAGADLILCVATNPNLNTPALGIGALDALTSALARSPAQPNGRAAGRGRDPCATSQPLAIAGAREGADARNAAATVSAGFALPTAWPRRRAVQALAGGPAHPCSAGSHRCAGR